MKTKKEKKATELGFKSAELQYSLQNLVSVYKVHLISKLQ